MFINIVNYFLPFIISFSSDNPCLTNASLSPIYAQTIDEILLPVYKLEKLNIICLSGLFPDCCYDELEDKIKYDYQYCNSVMVKTFSSIYLGFRK